MKTFQTIKEVQAFSQQCHSEGKTVGFIPTMGALHSGHLALVKRANDHCDYSIASIFINPTQFNNEEDLIKYPQTIQKDKLALKKSGCQAVFIPEAKEIYAAGTDVKIDLGEITKELEGKFRPGHFEGVALVVAKLFNIVQPDSAFFGQKDIQQFFVVNKLKEVLNFPIEIIMVSTERETNGLAMSSRNQRLSDSDREEAGLIYHALKRAKKELLEGISITDTKSRLHELFKTSKRLVLEYFEVVDTRDFKPLQQVKEKEYTVLCLAAEIGNVRLIDNVLLIS